MSVEVQAIDDADTFKFFGLGGCNEVGRLCHIIEYKNKVIMLDSGVHPGLSGMNSLPFFDEYDLSKVDILLISHFHLDHAASLPYVMQQTSFNGRVFMTHATKAIYRWLLSDFVRVTSITGGGDEGRQNGPSPDGPSANLYTDEDLMSSFDRIETIDYHSTMDVEGIRFTAYHAGHVLGACMYYVEVGGLKVLFTGDYSREEDRHLKVAEVPPTRPDILITESTFGTATHEPRLQKEARMMKIIHSTVLKGGRVLMPVFALGRAQELLLILEEYWSQNEDIQNVNVYYASNLARKCMAVYQTYTSIMSEKFRLLASSAQKANPFDFKHVKSIRNLDKVHDLGPCVVVASPGMLQSGFSRQLLERWAPDQKNALIMTGYSVEGTLAKDLLAEPAAFQLMVNAEVSIPRRLSVDEISFAAHVDFQQNAGFIDECAPSKIILVHGDSHPMGRLKSALLSKYSSRKGTDEEVRVFNPRNCELLQIGIKGAKLAKVVGRLAMLELARLKEAMGKIEPESMEVDSATVVKEEPAETTSTEVKAESVAPETETVTETSTETETKTETNTETETVATEAREATGTAEPETGTETPEAAVKSESAQNGVKAEAADGVKAEVGDGVKAEAEAEAKYVSTGVNLDGVLISKDFDVNLLQLEDLQEYTLLTTSVVKSNVRLKIIADSTLVAWHLERMFGYIHVLVDDELTWECLIMDTIYIAADKASDGLNVTVEWINDHVMADSLADCVVAILYSIDSSPMSVKLTLKLHLHIKQEDEEPQATDDKAERVSHICVLLRAHFGDSIKKMDTRSAVVDFGKYEAHVDFEELKVDCKVKLTREKIERILRIGCNLAAPLSTRPALN